MQGSRRRAHPLRLPQLGVVALSILGAPSWTRGADPRSAEIVREALREGDYPWYDARRDDVVRGKTLWRDGMMPPEPRSDRRGTASGGRDGPHGAGGRSSSAEPSPSDRGALPSGTLFEVLLSAVIALGVAWLGYLLYVGWRGRRKEEAEGLDPDAAPGGAPTDALPEGLRAAGGDPLKALRAAYEAGRLGEAMMYLFTHQLLSLDRHGHIVLERGKTNRRYLRELPREGALRGLMERSLRLFEDSFFGGREPARDELDALWGAWRRVEPELGRGRPRGAIAFPATAVLVAGALIGALAGCRSGDESTYGIVSGTSLNGSGVFARVLESDGHEVETVEGWQLLLDPTIDVAVYFQPRHEAPPEETLDLLDTWLLGDATGRRTLLYVVRDYDARIDFLRGVLEWADGELLAMASERLRAIESEEHRLRWESSLVVTPWFRYEKALQPTRCEAIYTSSSWNETIRAETASVLYSGQLDRFGGWTGFPSSLIECAAGPVAAELRLGGPSGSPGEPNRVIAVANGSFLVNYALVNQEHRALALALSRELGRGRRIAFVEDRPARRVRATEEDEEAPPNVPTGLALLAVWPLNGVIAQLLLVGVLYALYRFPILGRPRSPRQQVPGFSRHVEALGSLLEDTGDRALAREIVRRCRDQLSSVGAPRGVGARRRQGLPGVKQARP